MLRTIVFIFFVQVNQVGRSIIPDLLDWGVWDVRGNERKICQ